MAPFWNALLGRRGAVDGRSIDGIARSSTASHFTSGAKTATTGVAEDAFHGIPLSNDLSAAPAEQLVGLLGLVLLLGVAVLPPLLEEHRRSDRPAARAKLLLLWGCVGWACWEFLPAVTWIPALTNAVYTRTCYPYLVVIPHAISANISYRNRPILPRSKDGTSTAAKGNLESLLMSFLLYGFGGSMVTDTLMGLPITAVAHPRIVPCHILGWLLVWYSPGDAVYRSYQTGTCGGSALWRAFVVVCEAVDAVTTPMGRIARAARELRSGVAPLLAGYFAGVGGCLLRWAAAGFPGGASGLEGASYKTLGYSLLFWFGAVHRCRYAPLVEDDAVSASTLGIGRLVPWEWAPWSASAKGQNHCASYNGSDDLRVWMVTAHVAWTLLVDAGWASGHPFSWIGARLAETAHGLLGWLSSLGRPTKTTTTTKEAENGGSALLLKKEN